MYVCLLLSKFHSFQVVVVVAVAVAVAVVVTEDEVEEVDLVKVVVGEEISAKEVLTGEGVKEEDGRLCYRAIF